MNQLLLVDDNDKYASILGEYFKKFNFSIDRVYSANEGIERLQKVGISYYSMVVTDITMEGQLAGLRLISYLHKAAYKGMMMVASTGFDVFPGMQISQLYFGAKGVSYLIPKKSVLRKDFLFYPARLFSRPEKSFQMA